VAVNLRKDPKKGRYLQSENACDIVRFDFHQLGLSMLTRCHFRKEVEGNQTFWTKDHFEGNLNGGGKKTAASRGKTIILTAEVSRRKGISKIDKKAKDNYKGVLPSDLPADWGGRANGVESVRCRRDMVCVVPRILFIHFPYPKG